MVFDLLFLLVFCGALCFIFGVIAPAIWIVWEKVIKGNPKSIWELYDEL